MEIIPAIYILNGHCVSLYKGSYQQKETYFKSPLEYARHFEREGAQKLYVIDLDGRLKGDFPQMNLVERMIKSVKIPVQVEADFTSIAAIEKAFAIGASKVVLRPSAKQIIREAIEKFGPEKVIVEMNAKGSEVVQPIVTKTINGKLEIEPDLSQNHEVVDFAEMLVTLGVKEIIYKDERSEGTLIHPNYDDVDRIFATIGAVDSQPGLKLYVSGGISQTKHLLLLKKIGATGAIINKAFFESMLTIKEAEKAVN